MNDAGARSVLVVDDETNMRRTLSDILTEEGFTVATADSGEKAVKMCAKQHYDAVLLDVRMRGIDGVEAFRRIRHKDRQTCVIMMSAYSVAELEKAALAEGVTAFLRKPLELDKVVELLARAGG